MSKPIDVSSDTFEAGVINSDLPVLVDFWAPWCGPCKMMAPVLEKIVDSFKGKLKVAKLNTDENQDLAVKYQITGIPCLIVFKNGTEAQRLVGYRTEAELAKELNKII